MNVIDALLYVQKLRLLFSGDYYGNIAIRRYSKEKNEFQRIGIIKVFDTTMSWIRYNSRSGTLIVARTGYMSKNIKIFDLVFDKLKSIKTMLF